MSAPMDDLFKFAHYASIFYILYVQTEHKYPLVPRFTIFQPVFREAIAIAIKALKVPHPFELNSCRIIIILLS